MLSMMWLLLLLAAPLVTEAAPRPNIIWVMADDMGWGEVGLYPATSPHGRIATPNLDRFGQEGMVFTNAYAGYTVCAPSRTTLFTGRHSGQFVKYGLSGTDLPAGANVTTTAMLLQSAGYTTGGFGKIAPLASPTTQGFDAFRGQISQVDCHNMYPPRLDVQSGSSPPSTVPLPLNEKNKSRELCMATPSAYNYTVDVFADDGMEWLRRVGAQKDKPFFLYLSFTVPHAGGWSNTGKESGQPVPTDLQYAKESWPNVEKDHAAVITYLDGKVGELLDVVSGLGIDKNTVIFFASDNGAHLEGGHSYKFFNSTGGLLGHKRSLYEGGVRSPTMVRWPETIPQKTSDHVWAFWDFLPTVAELAGVAPPEGLDGTSIVPTLMGKDQPPPEYTYFTWKGLGEADTAASGYSVRVGDWKGIVASCASPALHPSKEDKMLLYNLKDDPFESTDVSGDHADVVSKLKDLVVSKNLTCTCYQC